MRKAVKKYPNFVDFDNELNAKLCYTYKKGGETKYGLIVFKDGKDMKKIYHADLLKEGLAKLNRNNELPEYMKDLDPIEQDNRMRNFKKLVFGMIMKKLTMDKMKTNINLVNIV